MLFQKKYIFEPREQNPPVLRYMEKLTQTLIGGSGLGAIELVQNAPIHELNAGSNLIGTLVQVIIGVITLIGLLKKKRV